MIYVVFDNFLLFWESIQEIIGIKASQIEIKIFRYGFGGGRETRTEIDLLEEYLIFIGEESIWLYFGRVERAYLKRSGNSYLLGI